MPTMKQSMVELDPERYMSAKGPGASHLTQSTIMLSSLPAMVSGGDSLTRQFYGGRTLPTRRLIVPG